MERLSTKSVSLEAKSETNVLWLLLLFFNALFTFIGVILRDVAEEGYCSGVPSNGTNQDLSNARKAMYSIPIITFPFIAITVGVWVFCKQWHNSDCEDFKKWFKNKQTKGSCKDLVEDIFVGITGVFYLAGDNLFFLLGSDGTTSTGIPASVVRGYLLGIALLISTIPRFLSKLIDLYYEYAINTSDGTNGDDKKKDKLPVLFILFDAWIKLSLLAGVFDAIFTTLLDDVVDKNIDRTQTPAPMCPSFGITQSAAGFYGVMLFISVVACMVFCVATYCIYKRHRDKLDKWKDKCMWRCGLPLLILSVFIYIPLYVTADNNWPWFCLAMNDDQLFTKWFQPHTCQWVQSRLFFLVITNIMSLMYVVLKVVCLWLSPKSS